MGNTLTSAKGGPVFTNTPTQTTTDLNAGRAFTEKMGNRINDTSANRLVAAPVWPGLEWYETDTGQTWVYGASGWARTLEDTGWIVVGAGGSAPAFQNSWTFWSGLPIRFRRLNGVVYLQGRGSGTVNTVVFTLPAGFRPGQDFRFAIVDGVTETPGTCLIAAAGTVTPSRTTPNLTMSWIAEA